MTARSAVEGFLGQERIAVVGASASGQGFGAIAYRALKKGGYKVVPVHPSAATIDGDKAFPSIKDLPEPVGGVLVVVPPSETGKVVAEAAEAGVGHLWLQQGAESDEAIRMAEQEGMVVVHHECILMFARPGGFPHNMHRWVWGLLGKLPRD